MREVEALQDQMKIMSQQMVTLMQQMAALQQDNFSYKIEVQELMWRLQREVDSVYYLKGCRLMIQEPERVAQVHRIILEELEVDDEMIFYRNESLKMGEQVSDVATMARYLLFYILNKHLGMAWKNLSDIYGGNITNGATKIKAYMQNKTDRQIVEEVDRKAILLFQSQRPDDGYEDTTEIKGLESLRSGAIPTALSYS